MSQSSSPPYDLNDEKQFPPLGTPSSPQRARTAVVKLSNPQSANDQSSNTVAATPPKGYYVIIGCGAAAVVNHTTLRRSKYGKERLAHPDNKDVILPVMHIGFEDPWRSYHAHGMGQPPYLLNLPGLTERPGPQHVGTAIRSGMRSTEFAALTRAEWDLLKTTFEFEHQEKFVAVVQPRESAGVGKAIDGKIITALADEGLDESQIREKLNSDFPINYPPLRLLVVDEEAKLDFVYAYKIDMCSGMGRASVVESDRCKATCKAGRTMLWVPPHKWDEKTRRRPIVTGPEALCSHTTWRSNDRVAVFGSGGIGLNMVERAEDEKCLLDWLPNPLPGNAAKNYKPQTTLHRSFNLPRNDTVLRHSILGQPPNAGKTMKPGESGIRNATLAVANLDVRLIPCDEHWRFMSHTDLESVTSVPKNQVWVSVKKVVDREVPLPESTVPEATDFSETAVPIDFEMFAFTKWYSTRHQSTLAQFPNSSRYSRLFMCVGIGNADQPGLPQTVLGAFELERLKDKAGRTVGLVSKGDERFVRVLGAAAANYPGENVRDKVTNDYFISLPYSAVPPGFIYSAVTAAQANEFFDEDNPNLNVNTMPESDVKKVLQEGGLGPTEADTLAKRIVAARRMRNGFPDLDAVAAAIEEDNTCRNILNWKQALVKLNTAYSYAPDFWPAPAPNLA